MTQRETLTRGRWVAALAPIFVAGVRRPAWHFDVRSALIGAVLAWGLAGLVYVLRDKLPQLQAVLMTLPQRVSRPRQDHAPQPGGAWGAYLGALRGVLARRLLFAPRNPPDIFQPPTFLAPATLPDEPTDELPPPTPISFAQVTEGHPRILITGRQAAGRTMALSLLVWQPQAEEKRIPLWLDMAQFKALGDNAPGDPLAWLLSLAAKSAPHVPVKQLRKQLRGGQPALLLVDNWEALSRDESELMLAQLEQLIPLLEGSVWVVASSPRSYGPLMEHGFVPLEIVPDRSDKAVRSLYAGWAHRTPEQLEEDEEVLAQLSHAARAGASLLELTLRIHFYLETQQLPERLTDVMTALVEERLPRPDLGADLSELAEYAQLLAVQTLAHAAYLHRLEKRALTDDDIRELINRPLPEAEEQPPKLAQTAFRLFKKSGFFKRQGKTWHPAHYVWEDFLTAWFLSTQDWGSDLIRTHRNDPSWDLLIEFYVGLGDASALVEAHLKDAAINGDDEKLLQAARWGILAPPDAAWRKSVLQALAQAFVDPDIDPDLRLRLAQMMAEAAGEGARSFFIQALNHADTAIRCAALRGMGRLSPTQSMPLLASALQDEEPEIRQSAVYALADMGTSGAASLLGQVFYESDEDLMVDIAYALARIPKGRQVLREAASAPDLMVRRSVAYGLGEIDQPWATELLEQLAREDDEWLVRSAADTALQSRSERQAAAQATVAPPPRVDELPWLISWAASHGLGVGAGEAAMDMLEHALVKGEPEAQMLGALTLVQLGRREHLELLRQLAGNVNPTVRRVARQVLRIMEQRYYDAQESSVE